MKILIDHQHIPLRRVESIYEMQTGTGFHPMTTLTESQSTRLTEGQATALESLRAFANRAPGTPNMMTLQGYAGTGKTYLMGALLRELGKSVRVAVAAPTNKAVGVLQDKIGSATGAEFRSIHSFLGLRMSEREDGTMECKPGGLPSLHEYDLAIIDECSMIGASLFEMIVTSAHGCRVLFVGDPAQLPPIDTKAITAQESPTFSHVQRRAMLSEIVRQAAGNPIIALSMRIRDAIEAGQPLRAHELIDALPQGSESHVSVGYGGEAAIFNAALNALQAGMDARIVAYTNAAVDAYNRALHAALYDSRTPFAVGERVIVNEQYDEARAVGASGLLFDKSRRVALYTSEEALIESIEPEVHPHFPQVVAFRVSLFRGETESQVFGYVPADRAAFEAEKSRLWGIWRQLKATEGTRGHNRQTCTAASQAAILFTKAFLPIRHVYAITAHKSQGSTIDTVIVDYNNLSKIKDPFTFNRSLYVAVTRAARFMVVIA